MFATLIELLKRAEPMDFDMASTMLIEYVNQADDFLELLRQIGTIPEEIEADSTAEKLFSKVSDAVLARAFREIGLKAGVLRDRGDSADVFAESKYHGYSLVADAKAFRLSRTAKNQKDFKPANKKSSPKEDLRKKFQAERKEKKGSTANRPSEGGRKKGNVAQLP